MPEYIERAAVASLISAACAECRDSCEEFDGFYADCNQCLLHGVKEKLPTIPAADVREVIRGKWLFDDFDGDGLDYQCTCCGGYSRSNYDFCPNCGAIMYEEGQK